MASSHLLLYCILFQIIACKACLYTGTASNEFGVTRLGNGRIATLYVVVAYTAAMITLCALNGGDNLRYRVSTSNTPVNWGANYTENIPNVKTVISIEPIGLTRDNGFASFVYTTPSGLKLASATDFSGVSPWLSQSLILQGGPIVAESSVPPLVSACVDALGHIVVAAAAVQFSGDITLRVARSIDMDGQAWYPGVLVEENVNTTEYTPVLKTGVEDNDEFPYGLMYAQKLGDFESTLIFAYSPVPSYSDLIPFEIATKQRFLVYDWLYCRTPESPLMAFYAVPGKFSLEGVSLFAQGIEAGPFPAPEHLVSNYYTEINYLSSLCVEDEPMIILIGTTKLATNVLHAIHSDASTESNWALPLQIALVNPPIIGMSVLLHADGLPIVAVRGDVEPYTAIYIADNVNGTEWSLDACTLGPTFMPTSAPIALPEFPTPMPTLAPSLGGFLQPTPRPSPPLLSTKLYPPPTTSSTSVAASSGPPVTTPPSVSSVSHSSAEVGADTSTAPQSAHSTTSNDVHSTQSDAIQGDNSLSMPTMIGIGIGALTLLALLLCLAIVIVVRRGQRRGARRATSTKNTTSPLRSPRSHAQDTSMLSVPKQSSSLAASSHTRHSRRSKRTSRRLSSVPHASAPYAVIPANLSPNPYDLAPDLTQTQSRAYVTLSSNTPTISGSDGYGEMPTQSISTTDESANYSQITSVSTEKSQYVTGDLAAM